MSGIESPVIVMMSPVSSPTQPTTTTSQICENVANQLMLVLPDLEEIASKENVSIELQQVKEPETSVEKVTETQPHPQPLRFKCMKLRSPPGISTPLHKALFQSPRPCRV